MLIVCTTDHTIIYHRKELGKIQMKLQHLLLDCMRLFFSGINEA